MVDEIRTIPPKLTKTEWNALLDHSLEKDSNYIIRKSGVGEIQAINGSNGKKDFIGPGAVQEAMDSLD